MKKVIIASALALASFVSAQAANFASGDLILGFRADGGTGQSSNVLVDLGAASSFGDQASAFSLGSILTSTYGANWATRSDLHYGVFGASGTAKNSTAWASQAEDIAGTAQTNIFTNGNGDGTYVNGAINTGRSGYTTFQAYASGLTAVSSNVYVGDATAVAGWTNQEGKSAGVSWNFVSPYIDTTLTNTGASKLDGSAYGVLDLFKVTNNATVALGGLGLNSAGNVAFQTDVTNFAVVAIPEPSTYAIVLGALTIGFVALRRRFSKAV